MAKFLKDSELNAALEKLIENAEEYILFVSPYVKLHDRVRSSLKLVKEKYYVKIIVLFGKQEDGKSPTLNQDDVAFLQDFPNVEIRHEPRLHAKYYASESEALLSSMNLYDFSQNNNIEFGVQLKSGGLTNFAKGLFGFGDSQLDGAAGQYFYDVTRHAELLFLKEPETKSAGFLKLGEEYTHSTIKTDKLEQFFSKTGKQATTSQKSAPNSKASSDAKQTTGYCIRTKAPIPFNPKHPFSDSAFESWNKFKNPDFAEKYCHFSGEPSNGETSFSKPILKKNWSKAKEVFGF